MNIKEKRVDKRRGMLILYALPDTVKLGLSEAQTYNVIWNTFHKIQQTAPTAMVYYGQETAEKDEPVSKASLKEKASVISRVGMMFLSCGTGAWRVRSSMNTMSECMELTCTADIGLMSINYTCFDGEACFSQSLCLTNTGVNNSKLTRLEIFINDFVSRCDSLTYGQVI